MILTRLTANKLIGVLLFFVCMNGFGAAPLIEQSLEKLRQSPPFSPDCFDFVVTADSNTLDPLEQSDVFRQIIKEVNILKPALFVEVGDIVLGGAADGVPSQWDVFDQVIATCTVPYLPAPGNHDISDAATERIWLDRIGPTHYTFSYGNSFFMMLNSEEVGAIERISDEQVAWLEKELASTSAKNIFVFLHQPYFEQLGDPGTAEERWNKCWSNVAEAFRGHPVRAVFSGHEHIYRYCGVRDGVHYVIAGGAAVYGMGGSEAEGHFNHYLLVKVRGEDVSWSVIKPGSVLPQDVVTSDRMDELFNIRNNWVSAAEVCVPFDKAIDNDVKVTVRNPGGTTMKSSLTWNSVPGWTVAPERADYEVMPNGTADLLFHLKADRPAGAAFPVPAFQTLYTQTQYGPPIDIAKDLSLVPEINANRAQGEIVLDAVLDEWKSAQMVPLIYPVGFEGKDKTDLDCRLGFLWDDKYLYLAVETVDNEHSQPYAGDIVWKADNVEMFIDGWSWGISLTEKGPEVFLYWGVDVSAETVNADVKLAVKREGTKTTYEAAFPQSHLNPLKLETGKSFLYNALMNDLDPSGPTKPRHWLQLVPSAVSEGSPPPRVKVVLR